MDSASKIVPMGWKMRENTGHQWIWNANLAIFSYHRRLKMSIYYFEAILGRVKCFTIVLPSYLMSYFQRNYRSEE